MYKSEEDGTVQHDDGLCIGCQQCVNSCPYGVPRYFPERTIVGKCYACKDTRDFDGTPTCVAACPQRAIEFGLYDDLKAIHPDAVADVACFPESFITDPSVLMDVMPRALDKKYRELRL
jgi:anaerobic dimethyl sulfoxide reductase subunit B (iron-sulfur subunit)